MKVGFTINGYYLCAESGGGREVVANRTAYGAWEQWEIEKHDNDRIALRADNGDYLCAELDGTVNANRKAVGEWELWKMHVDGNNVALESHHGKFLCAELGGGSEVVANRPAVGPWETFTPTNTEWIIKTCKRPLIGPLRVENKFFRDDSGIRRVHFDSAFTLMKILREDPQRFKKSQDDCVDAGYQGRRVFLNVGGWEGFWDNHEVLATGVRKWIFDRNNGGHTRPAGYGTTLPSWHDYDNVFRALLRDCKARGLRLHVTFGDCQIFFENDFSGNQEVALVDHLAGIAAEEGGAEVIAFWETTNEVPINRRGGVNATQHMIRLMETVRQRLPNVLCGMGAFLSEEPQDLFDSIQGSDVCFVHPSRWPAEHALKRTFGLTNWEGHWRYFPVPYVEGEPAGPNISPLDGIGDDVYQPMNDPSDLISLYSMHALLGHASVWFDGASVRGIGNSVDAWGYKEIPKLLTAVIPEDIATWNHQSDGRGGIMYFFKGKNFITATTKNWFTNPPFPIATWTAYVGTEVINGVGTPPQLTGLIEGRFS